MIGNLKCIDKSFVLAVLNISIALSFSKNVIIKSTGEKYVVSGDLWAHESIVSYQPTKIIEQSSEERQPTDESD